MMRAPALLLVLSAGCSLRPSDQIPAPHGIAALAIRDDVPAWQEWGTRLHSEPFLQRAYATYAYLEEEGIHDPEQVFEATLHDLLQRHEQVDLFLLAHSNRYVRIVERIEPDLRRKLRLVYNTGAGDLDQAQRWIGLGAAAYVGHPGANNAPLFYVHFLPRWLEGSPLREAVSAANADTKAEMLSLPMRGSISIAKKLGAPVMSAEDVWRGTEASIAGDPELRNR